MIELFFAAGIASIQELWTPAMIIFYLVKDVSLSINLYKTSGYLISYLLCIWTCFVMTIFLDKVMKKLKEAIWREDLCASEKLIFSSAPCHIVFRGELAKISKKHLSNESRTKQVQITSTYDTTRGISILMPSPSAFWKFGLSILNFFKHAQFFMYTQNHFGILKSKILLHKLAHLSTPKMFWV